jgi:hypothetical protein
MGLWVNCSIRTHRQCGGLTCRHLTAAKPPSFGKGNCSSNHPSILQLTYPFGFQSKTSTPLGRLMWSCTMKTTMGRKSLLEMMPKVRERLRLRHSLPTRSVPACWESLTLQLMIGLPQPPHQEVIKRRDMLHLELSANLTEFQPMR